MSGTRSSMRRNESFIGGRLGGPASASVLARESTVGLLISLHFLAIIVRGLISLESFHRLMPRLRPLLHHALTVVAGGTALWLVQWLSMPLIALIPGFEPQVVEWVALAGPNPHEIGRFAVSVLLAGLLQLARVSYKGRNVTFAFAMMLLLVSIDARAGETPRELRDVLGLWALFRFAGIYAAAAVMSRVQTRVPEEARPEVTAA